MRATSFTPWCAFTGGFFGAVMLAISVLAETVHRNCKSYRQRGPIIAEAIGFESDVKSSPSNL
jgi:hypothetical protein